MNFSRNALLIIGGSFLLFVFSVNVLIPAYLQTSYSADLADGVGAVFIPALIEIPIVHLPTPEPLKALYMTSCVAATPSWRTSLKNLIEETELNAVVIDIKDYTGRVSFPNDFPKTIYTRGCVISDIKDFVAKLHASGIYVIGRISVFQDPSYAELYPELAVKSIATGEVWRDYKGLSFIDVGAEPYWDYIVQISRAAYELGFDELNYDYIRYPSDGNMADANYTWMEASSTRAQVLEEFFAFLDKQTQDLGVVTSADLFGMTTTITNDMGIGQVLERTLPYFDYISPMVYPSHYPNGWHGFANPAEYPYEVVQIAMFTGRERELALNFAAGFATSTPSKLRPWLQDFNLGTTYGPDKVRAQIQATYDAGLTSWMVWSAANKYTREALLSEEVLAF
jgi:hypothetical protein